MGYGADRIREYARGHVVTRPSKAAHDVARAADKSLQATLLSPTGGPSAPHNDPILLHRLYHNIHPGNTHIHTHTGGDKK